MEKSVDAFRTISEVADDLDLPQHVLRFWETRFPQVRPLKRAGGRRYYRPQDVVLLRSIRQLLYDDGYTIKGVQRLLKEKGTRGFRDVSHDADRPEADVSFEADTMVSSSALQEAGEFTLRRSETSSQPGVLNGRASILEALAAIEECERILQACAAPVHEREKRLQGGGASL